MIKNKTKLLISSVIILLPILLGLMVWKQLPEQVPTHWGPSGEPDGWSSKAFAVFGLPAILLGCHLVCLFASSSHYAHANRKKRCKLKE